MKKTAIYIRVSTEAQREEGYSIEAQTEALKAFCLSKGWKHYEFYIDGGFSGSNLNRPEMQRLMGDCEVGSVERVLVYKLDRLSRSQKDTLHLIEDVFNPNQVDFVSLNENMDTGTPMGRLMLGILSAFAQLERENIKERTRMGMKERVKAGYWMGGGKVPFGYDYDSEKGILVPNSDADTVRHMYELYLSGYSPGEIAEITGFRYEYQIVQILKRKTNTGVISYQGQEYAGKHTPIISDEIYEQTMLVMEERSRKPQNTETNLLTGLVFCGHCGSKMRYQKWGMKGHKLVCYSRQGSKEYLIRDPNCPQEHIWADQVENAVIQDLFHFSVRQDEKAENENSSVVELLKEEQEKNRKRLERLYHLYADQEDDLLLKEIKERKRERESIEKRIRLEQEQQMLSNKKAEVRKSIQNLSGIWKNMTKREQRLLITQVIQKITLTDENVIIEYRI